MIYDAVLQHGEFINFIQRKLTSALPGTHTVLYYLPPYVYYTCTCTCTVMYRQSLDYAGKSVLFKF